MSSRPQGGPECRTIEPVSPPAVGGKSFVVSSRTVRRSPRPRPGRTSPSRPSGSGSALAAASPAGAGVAGVSGRALQPPAPVARPGCRPRRSADLRAARADRLEPAAARRRARDRPLALDRASGAPARRRLPPPAARAPGRRALPVAVPRPAAAHGHQEARQVRPSPATPSPATGRSARAASAGSTCTRSSTTARRLAYSEIHDDETRRHRDRLHRARARLLPRPRHRRRAADDRQRVRLHPQPLAARAAPRARAIRHLRTRPYTPRTNGKVERYQQTLQREWAYALEYASSDARRASLPHWVRHYNERRTHSALGNRPPIDRVREVTGLDS